MSDDFKAYGAQVKANAAKLAETLQSRGLRIVSGGTMQRNSCRSVSVLPVLPGLIPTCSSLAGLQLWPCCFPMQQGLFIPTS
ncbi:hypothetical protein H1D41_12160 [Rhodobacteraceae bacterium MYP1-1]|uniref:Uncharacterized protein n=2 Tax=Halocynthiibacter styelae TaxID=2761955 RepID=A0A8J7IJM4_9RHOB|nr:hypothetical protein [Paenihalocynthiibacter styelae]